MNVFFPVLVFYLLKVSFSLSQYKHASDSPSYPISFYKHHPISSPFCLKALQSLPRLSFYWTCFSTSSALTYQLPSMHLITCLEIWCFSWLLWLLLPFCYDFPNHFSSMSFCLIPSILVFWGNLFSPTSISSPSLWHHSYSFSNQCWQFRALTLYLLFHLD